MLLVLYFIQISRNLGRSSIKPIIIFFIFAEVPLLELIYKQICQKVYIPGIKINILLKFSKAFKLCGFPLSRHIKSGYI